MSHLLNIGDEAPVYAFLVVEIEKDFVYVVSELIFLIIRFLDEFPNTLGDHFLLLPGKGAAVEALQLGQ